MEAAIAAFAERAGIQARYGCRWTGTRREESGFVLETWTAVPLADRRLCDRDDRALDALNGAEHATHYVDTGSAESYRDKRVVIIGKKNSGLRARVGAPAVGELTLVSPRAIDISVLAKSPLRARYLSPTRSTCARSAPMFSTDRSSASSAGPAASG